MRWVNKPPLTLTDFAIDPIFFLHHGQIDRLWTLWQKRDLAAREMAFGGPKTQGSAPVNASLEDVMSTHSELLCYEYA